MSADSLWVGTNIADRYCITGEIGGGAMGRVYRAIPFDDPAQTVAIKVIQRDRLDYEAVLRFQREAALMSRLRHPNIITFLELGLYQPQRSDGSAVISGYYIVMEVANGHDLKESLARGGRKNLEFFFDLGLQVSSALEYTHAKNIIHRDIKPQNIIIERGIEGIGGHLVKVLDFGIARLTDLNLYSDDDNTQDVAGTPLYMAPETSKYLDAPVDHRVDLYSLGCVLYEVLAGRPPFVGSTREKLARGHAYATPEPLTTLRPDLPSLVNDVVTKLIAKHPKDRYQTAFGLHVDLQRIRRILRSQRPRGQRFILGRYDKLNILPSNIPMVGRQEQFDALVSNYTAIANQKSRSRLAVIKGGPGTGKTRLLKEFRGYLSQHKIRFISTNFSRHENNLPFNALANGFNEYLIHTFKNQPIEAEEIKRRVRALLGPTAELVAKIVQGLRPYLDVKAHEELVGSELESDKGDDFHDFAKAFSDFTRCLSNESETVTIFLDDMHWADQKSLELIDRFFSYNNSQQFLLVISHRTPESNSNADFQAFLAKFSKLKRRYQEIELDGLPGPAVCQLSQSILAMDKELDARFSQYLKVKTSGNPLYVLELHRSLVTQEFISLDMDGSWQCQIEEVYRTPIHSTSIDLTLNRLSELSENERKVLEVASVLGSQFQIDNITISKDMSLALVKQTIQDAVESGLLLKVQDPGLEGQVYHYIFSHRSIREALLDNIPHARRRELHRLVATQSEDKENISNPQLIFTLANHYFQALSLDENQDMDLVKKALQYNLQAGAKALEVHALLTAQRYYQNARLMIPLISGDETQSRYVEKQVNYALADIHFANRDFVGAGGLYLEIRKLPLSRVEFAYVSYKLALLNLVGGYVGVALKEVVYTFRKLRFPRLSNSRWEFFWALCRFRMSVLRPLPKSLPLAILKKAKPVVLKAQRQTFHPFLLYLVGQEAGLNFDKRLGLVYHMGLMDLVRKHSMPEDIVLRLLCDHAAMLARYGFRVRAYQLLEIVQRRAQERDWKSLMGYVSFTQVLHVDAYQGKSEDPRYQITAMKEGLQSVDFRLAFMQENIYRIFVLLSQGQGKELTKLTQSLPHILTMRHWLTPRAVAMYLFWLLLTDSRDLIVSYSGFIEKRARFASRRYDPFVKITEIIVDVAAGEHEKARAIYYDVLTKFNDGMDEPVYLPHEVDFILLFLSLFPDIYAFEYGEHCLDYKVNPKEMQRLLRLTLRSEHQARPVPILVYARLQELAEHKSINHFYDAALRKAKMSQLPFIEILAELWFGRHLQLGRAMLRVDYLQKVSDRSRALGLTLLHAICRQISRDQGTFLQEDFSAQLAVQNLVTKEPLDSLLFQHIRLLSELRPTEYDLAGVKSKLFELLRERFEFEHAHLVTWTDFENQRTIGTVPTHDKWQQIVAYLLPYSHLRSSLTVPVGDAPWILSESKVSELPVEAVQGDASYDMLSPLLDSTTEARAEDLQTLVMDRTEVIGVAKGSSDGVIPSPSAPKQPIMNTMVPLRYGGQELGLLFLEKNRLQNQDSTLQRQLLDTLGAQVGIWLCKYLPPRATQSGSAPMYYAAGGFHLEPCHWLHFWTEGSLRSARESVWYLGLNLDEQNYIITYCCLNGPEDIRTSLSSVLWHEMLAIRTLLSDTGSNLALNTDDLREALERHLHSHPGIQSLEGLSLSFSVLQRQKGEIISGHFGPTRPLVMGSHHDVTPLNRVVLSLQNGRYLRYWKVVSLSLQHNIFVLSPDTNKLDGLNIRDLREAQFETLSLEQKRFAFREFLKSHLIAGQEPAHYFAATYPANGQASIATMERVG